MGHNLAISISISFFIYLFIDFVFWYEQQAIFRSILSFAILIDPIEKKMFMNGFYIQWNGYSKMFMCWIFIAEILVICENHFDFIWNISIIYTERDREREGYKGNNWMSEWENLMPISLISHFRWCSKRKKNLMFIIYCEVSYTINYFIGIGAHVVILEPKKKNGTEQIYRRSGKWNHKKKLLLYNSECVRPFILSDGVHIAVFIVYSITDVRVDVCIRIHVEIINLFKHIRSV